MKKEKLEQIKRMIYLEGKIQEIATKYSESKNFDKERKLKFYYKNIDSLESGQFTIEDLEYFNIACIVPFEELQIELLKYDSSSPKMDEIKFIEDLMKKYDVSKDIICTRIRQVRKINKLIVETQSVLESSYPKINITDKTIENISKYQRLYLRSPIRTRMGLIYINEEFKKKSDEVLGKRMPGGKDENQKFIVLAVPCRRSFVVAPDKTETFKKSTNSKRENDFVRRVAETFRKNNLVEDKPKVKKIGSKKEKK